MQLLWPTAGFAARATDINASNMVSVCEIGVDVADRAVVWVNGEPNVLLDGPEACALSINDAGVVTGYVFNMFGATYVSWTVVPVDSDFDGSPDTWFVDDDNDGVNDLLMLLSATDDSWDALYPNYILNDYRIVASQSFMPPILITPDFTDPDGDGNPWSADANAEFVNGLATGFGDDARVIYGQGGDFVAGADHATATAAIWSISQQSTVSLGRLGSRDISSWAYDVNAAGWAVGYSVGKRSRTFFFYKDGTMTAFSELSVSAAAEVTFINDAGVIAGFIGDDVMVALPSVAP